MSLIYHIAFILIVFGLFTLIFEDFSEKVYMFFGIVLTARVFVHFNTTRKYHIALEGDKLNVRQKDHDFNIEIDKIDNAQYSNHRMIISSNGLNYGFDLYGYNRKRVEDLVNLIKLKL